MTRYCLTLDLKDDPHLIKKYIEYHKNVWPEIEKSLKDSGIDSMQIYHVATRLFMIIETYDDFTFEKKRQMDNANIKVVEWETLMENFQQKVPFAKKGEKWVMLQKVYELK